MSPATYLLSLGLFGGSLLLAVTSGLALAALGSCFGKGARWPVVLLAKAVVLWPLTALIWSAMGYWAGHLGQPVLSLMPAAASTDPADLPMRMAHIVWWWAPPLFLLALPMTAQVLASATEDKKPWYSQVRSAGFLGILLLPVVENAFDLPGALAGILPALQAPVASSSLLLTLAPWAGLALAWYCLASAWPHSPVPCLADADGKVREGALVIGLSPHEVWKRHLRSNQIRRGLARLCSVAALLLSLWVSYGLPGLAAMSSAWQEALQQALTNPVAPLAVSWPYALCALSLWLLGRMILPRQR
ncbi:hypothetical protein WJU23_02385 [Prosthecobacter sp. SYSU 5D2]|uniref:hypothetical protein n=1 Tax=Prosthecobacter sp. SYSU 5D2 TaxID=3134134 RepID=UPI0031FEF83A